jgi:Holliday junction resolvasome RuvABC endonuclease subunit
MHRLDYMRELLLGVLDVEQPSLACVEGYSYGSTNAREVVAEWGGVLRWTLWQQGVPFAEIPPSTLKAFATGKGNSEKTIVVREVFRKWAFEAKDDNEADACVLARLCEEMMLSQLHPEAATLKVQEYLRQYKWCVTALDAAPVGQLIAADSALKAPKRRKKPA